MYMRIPPLKLKIMVESSPLNLRILVRRLALSATPASAGQKGGPSAPSRFLLLNKPNTFICLLHLIVYSLFLLPPGLWRRRALSRS